MQENAIYINRLWKDLKNPDVHRRLYFPVKPGDYIGLAVGTAGLEATNADSLLVFCQAGKRRLQFFDAGHGLNARRRRAGSPKHYQFSLSSSTVGAEFTCRKVIAPKGGRRSAA